MSAPLREPLIFDYSRRRPRRDGAMGGRGAGRAGVPEALRRAEPPLLPEASELDVVRHYTRLSQLNFSIDTHFYPLGSCTMKYNPQGLQQCALLPEFLGRHPLARSQHSQGFLACMYELQEMLQEVTGMQAVSLSPMAGAHGEFAGVAMIRAYHRARGDLARNEIIVPDGGAWHQSRHRQHVRLRGARDQRHCRRRRRPGRAARGGRPAHRRHHADQSLHAGRVRAPHRARWRASCTMPAACCTTTAPT